MKLDQKSIAFSDQGKEPLENASQVRDAIVRISQVKGARPCGWTGRPCCAH